MSEMVEIDIRVFRRLQQLAFRNAETISALKQENTNLNLRYIQLESQARDLAHRAQAYSEKY